MASATGADVRTRAVRDMWPLGTRMVLTVAGATGDDGQTLLYWRAVGPGEAPYADSLGARRCRGGC